MKTYRSSAQCSIAAAAVLAVFFIATPTALSANNTDEDVIGELVIANRILADQGVLDGFGHVSARSKKNPDHFFMAVARAPGIVTRADIVEIDLDGKPVKPETRELYGERFIHTEIFRARPDISGVVHSHAASVLPFSVSKIPLRPLIHVAYFLGDGPTPVFEIRDAAGENNRMLVNTPQTGSSLAKTLGTHTVVLMRGHGMAVAGETLRDAVFRAIYTQVNAAVQSEALKLGEPTYLNSFEVQRTELVGRQWENWVARVRPQLEPAQVARP